MPIENRELTIGTKLVARHKKVGYQAEVVAGEGGKVKYRLEDGREFKSPSAAGTAITGGACNGWAFWSVEGTEPVTAPPAATAETPAKPKQAVKQPRPINKAYAEHVAEASAEAEDTTKVRPVPKPKRKTKGKKAGKATEQAALTTRLQRNLEACFKKEGEMLIPEYDPIDPKPYPGDIKPGVYTKKQVNALGKKHQGDAAVLGYLADMLEV